MTLADTAGQIPAHRCRRSPRKTRLRNGSLESKSSHRTRFQFGIPSHPTHRYRRHRRNAARRRRPPRVSHSGCSIALRQAGCAPRRDGVGPFDIERDFLRPARIRLRQSLRRRHRQPLACRTVLGIQRERAPVDRVGSIKNVGITRGSRIVIGVDDRDGLIASVADDRLAARVEDNLVESVGMPNLGPDSGRPASPEIPIAQRAKITRRLMEVACRDTAGTASKHGAILRFGAMIGVVGDGSSR